MWGCNNSGQLGRDYTQGGKVAELDSEGNEILAIDQDGTGLGPHSDSSLPHERPSEEWLSIKIDMIKKNPNPLGPAGVALALSSKSGLIQDQNSINAEQAVIDNGMALALVREDLRTAELCALATQSSPFALYFVPDEHLTPEDWSAYHDARMYGETGFEAFGGPIPIVEDDAVDSNESHADDDDDDDDDDDGWSTIDSEEAQRIENEAWDETPQKVDFFNQEKKVRAVACGWGFTAVIAADTKGETAVYCFGSFCNNHGNDGGIELEMEETEGILHNYFECEPLRESGLDGKQP